jgi:hypothetical protein
MTQLLSDWIRVYDDLVPEKFCDDCVNLFEDKIRSGFELEWRRCREMAALGSTYLFAPLKHHMRAVLSQYKDEVKNKMLDSVTRIEDPSIFCYAPAGSDPAGDHHFHKHCDAWSVESASRQVSIILYLNDVERGGETVFEDIEDLNSTGFGAEPRVKERTDPSIINAKPRKGRVLVFPSNYLFHHEGRTPISEAKYVLVSWLHFDGAGHGYRTYPLYD